MRRILKIFQTGINLSIASLMSLIIYFDCCLPGNYYVASGGSLEISDTIMAVETEQAAQTDGKALTVGSVDVRRTELKLFGIFPIKTVNVQEVDEPLLIPCGEPFGIKLLTDGVMVVEVTSFETENGFKSPAHDGGIKAGDVIKTVDGKKVWSNSEIEKIISSGDGADVEVEAVRDGKSFTATVKPLKSTSDNKFRAGIWVRDSSAGIGTMTFYDPQTKVFAGLGHPVCDIDTGQILPLYSGEAIKVMINGVKKGRSGVTGELMGGFTSISPIGTLEENDSTGLYGIMEDFNASNQAIPLAMRQEIKTGEAFIYTTTDGNTPEKYEILIEKINPIVSDESRNMIIRITDETLLEEAGGIVQGMSGSPIIQDGKLVGAVTHVFVNNPTKGYAIFADTMYEEAKQISEDKAVQ